MSSLGVVVYSLRGMRYLSQCLDSVRWADAVTVRSLDQETEVDSEVKSVPRAQEVGTDWVLHLWGDECVGAELAEELQLIRKAGLEAGFLAYLVPIRSHLLGRWVRGSLWSPSPSLRLCRRVEELPYHWWNSKLENPGGKSGLLHGWIGDYSCTELQGGVERLNVISGLWAQRLQADGRTLSHALIAAYPVQVLTRLLFVDGLLLQGMAGLSLSVLAAYATLASGMKLVESRSTETR